MAQRFKVADLVAMSYTLTSLRFDVTASNIDVGWTDSGGGSHFYSWTETTPIKASALMAVLRSADLSQTSMDERIFGQLMTEGVIPAGSMETVPEEPPA